MSSIDKLRSFAESRTHDSEIIEHGFTYGDARDIMNKIDKLVVVAKYCTLTPDNAKLYKAFLELRLAFEGWDD